MNSMVETTDKTKICKKNLTKNIEKMTFKQSVENASENLQEENFCKSSISKLF